MRNILANMKTLVLFLTLAFAGHVLATQDFWFGGTASGTDLVGSNANWTTNNIADGEVCVRDSFLEIDLPTNMVVSLTPDADMSTSVTNKRTYVVVDQAVFTPTLVDDIDNSVVADSQTALTAAYDENNVTNYYAYITNSWVKLLGQTPTAEAVDVTVVLDYSSSTRTNVMFKVGGGILRDASNNGSFPITKASSRRLGYIELAGYGKLHSITSLVEEVVVNITPGTVEYGADFTNATVTATVTSSVSDTDYYLAWDNGDRVKGTVDGGVVTFENVPIAEPSTAYQEASYTITAEVGESPFIAKNESTRIFDVRDWINENADTTTKPDAGGSWDGSVAYDENTRNATITGVKTFAASNCSTGDLVKITFSNIVYAEVSDLTVETPSGTQGAFALAETNINDTVQTNFVVLTPQSGWTAATSPAGVVANTNIAYTVEMSFNYTNNT